MVLGEEHSDTLGLTGVADYSFTEQELTDILGYMESHDPLGAAPPFAGPVGSFHALQFLPRSHNTLPTATLEFPSTSEPPAHAKSEPIVSDYKGELAAVHLPEPALPTKYPTGQSGRISTRSAQNGHKGDLPAGRKHGTKKGGHGRSGSGEYRHGHISHSTVEKQRRDRINSLIDELRELVPSQGTEGAPQEGSSESKRPKHVVLSDTIALVKDLQIKVRDTPPHSSTVSGECEEVGSPDDKSGGGPPTGAQADHAAQHSEQESEHSDSPEAAPEAPHDSAGQPPLGVTIEEGESCIFVKVNCEDRRGLLSDIIMALKSMPLEITTAAVTTGQDGGVHDVFQVRLDPRGGATPDDVRRTVEASLHSPEALGDKRRRTESAE